MKGGVGLCLFVLSSLSELHNLAISKIFQFFLVSSIQERSAHFTLVIFICVSIVTFYLVVWKMLQSFLVSSLYNIFFPKKAF